VKAVRGKFLPNYENHIENTTLREQNAEFLSTKLVSSFVIAWIQQAKACQYVICATSTTGLPSM
jgi:hypothetical protein